jgi:hypothetical protein
VYAFGRPPGQGLVMILWGEGLCDAKASSKRKTASFNHMATRRVMFVSSAVTAVTSNQAHVPRKGNPHANLREQLHGPEGRPIPDGDVETVGRVR